MDEPHSRDNSPSRIWTALRRNGRGVAVSCVRFILGSIFILLRKPLLERLLVAFVFHEVSDDPREHARETKTFSSLLTFQRQIHWIQESFQVRDMKKGQIDAQNGGCIVSFDDGYAGVVINALPVLQKANMPFICFVNVATINGEVNSSALAMYVAGIERRAVNWRESNPVFYARVLSDMSEESRKKLEKYQGPYLTKGDLQALAENSLATIGDHLYNHWYMNELSKSELESELARGQKELLSYDSCRPYFAAPHGVASQEALILLREFSIMTAFSGSEVQSIGHMRVYPRIDLNNDISSRQMFFGAVVISMLRRNLRRRRNKSESAIESTG